MELDKKGCLTSRCRWQVSGEEARKENPKKNLWTDSRKNFDHARFADVLSNNLDV
jgi:hypothetical protein